MKTIVKIEIVLLILVALAGTGMVLVSEGVLNLFFEPVILEPALAARPEEEVPAEIQPVEPPAEESAPKLQSQGEAWTVTAPKYFAYDIRQEAYLTKLGDENAQVYPASITKLLTSYVLLRHMQPTDTVEIGDALELVQEDSSVAGLEEGDKLTVEQLIAAMMLPSGNDAAQAAAVAAGRKISGNSSLSYEKAVKVFVDEMNKQAIMLGMESSHFANPDGFHHEAHYTTMNDLVILCKKVLTEPIILRYTSRDQCALQLPDRLLEWKNTNVLLHKELPSYMPNAMGLKTGYTDAAGNCQMSAFFMEDRILLIGVFGVEKNTETRYKDIQAIYQSVL